MSDCIFCKIAAGEFNTSLLYEDEQVIAFNDINPEAPHHFLVIPRHHFVSVKEMTDELLMGHLLDVGNKVAGQLDLDSYRMVFNTGKQAGQTVFHVHLHVLGGRSMNWPPG